MLNIVLFGPPGSGKGTQADKLKEKYGLMHISTGDLFRFELENNTPLGLKAREYVDKGLLVPDEIVIGMINSKLEEEASAKGVIYDGFPRTMAQAEALDKLLKEKNAPITTVLSLEVSNEELTKRILKRGDSSGRADDQDESIIEKRVIEYNEKTAILAGYYESQNKFIAIKGEGTIDDIFQSLCEQVDSVISID